VERSTDGIVFTKIGNVGAVNAAGTHTYHYTDRQTGNLNVPVVYYRLKMIDRNQAYTYSGIVTLYPKRRQIDFSIYPNPVSAVANLELSTDHRETLSVRFIDESGRLVKKMGWAVEPGNNIIPVNVEMMAPGVYQVELTGANTRKGVKLVKD
jgi:hypothetical protein